MPTEPHRILVIDDEPQIRRFLRISLTSQGFVVYEAANGREALTLAIEEAPHLVLLDLGLPDMDGQEVLDRLRARSQVPVIVVSVRGQEAEKVRALDHGANDYVTKPFGIQELLARIRALLRLRQADAPSSEGERYRSVAFASIWWPGGFGMTTPPCTSPPRSIRSWRDSAAMPVGS